MHSVRVVQWKAALSRKVRLGSATSNSVGHGKLSGLPNGNRSQEPQILQLEGEHRADQLVDSQRCNQTKQPFFISVFEIRTSDESRQKVLQHNGHQAVGIHKGIDSLN